MKHDTIKYAIIIAASALVATAIILAFVSNPYKTTNSVNNYTSSTPVSLSSQNKTTENVPTIPIEQNQELRKFNSTDELKTFLLASASRGLAQSGSTQGANSGKLLPTMNLPSTPVPSGETMQPPSQATQGAIGSSESSGPQYSTTNVQVTGVDEPDFIKNDGRYAYILSADKLTIVDAYPGQTAKIISKVGLDIKGQNLQSMFLNKDRVVIFYNDYVDNYYIPQYDYFPQIMSTPTTHAIIIDVSDRSNPIIVKNYEVTGTYYSARMIGDWVYLVSNSYADYIHPMPPILRESSKTIMVPNIYYFPNPESSYNFDTITSFNMFQDQVNSTTFLTGSTSALYVTNSSMYIAYQKSYDYYPYYGGESYSQDRFLKAVLPQLPPDIQDAIKSIIVSGSLDQTQAWAKISDLLQNYYNKLSDNDKSELFSKIQKSLAQYDAQIQEDMRKTVIQKFAIVNGTVEYMAQGQVPGYLLNQYSMDELGDRFRVATTSEYYDQENGSSLITNNVYVLDPALNIVGSLEKFASNESIYAARFVGDKLYLVTFQRIDPFFVVDLSTDSPKILGELKIPGYSSYLHPYDENHIIGIGRETAQNEYGGIKQLGVKVSLFDVSNVTSPITVSSYLIGGPETDSDVLTDPKAILFDKTKDLLVVPIKQQSYFIRPMPLETQGGVASGAVGESQVGNATIVNPGGPMIPSKPTIMPSPPVPFPITPLNNNWNGFYVFGINSTEGFVLRGIIEHYNGTTYQQYYSPQGGSRSFYINDSLYTVTPDLMKITALNDISNLINEIKLSGTGQLVKYLNQ